MENRTKPWNLKKLTQNEWLRLKNSGGLMLNEAPAEVIIIYRLARTGEQKSYYRDSISFACLCMRCLWDKDITRTKPFHELAGDLYRDTKTSKAIKSRLLEVMDDSWGEDGYLLRYLYSIAQIMRKRDGSIVPDFEGLTDMIANWNTRGVKRLWLNEIYK